MDWLIQSVTTICVLGGFMALLKMGISRSISNGDKVLEQKFNRLDEQVADSKRTNLYVSDQLNRMSADMSDTKIKIAIIQTELKAMSVRMDSLNEGFNKLVESHVKKDYGKVIKR